MSARPLAVLQQARPGDHARWALIAVLALLAWLAFEKLSAQLWFLPAGLRLALLWLVPTRRWGWLAAAEIGAQMTKSVTMGYPFLTPTFFAVCVVPWALYAGMVLVMRGIDGDPSIEGPGKMLRFLLAGLLAAAAVSPVLWAFLVTIPMTTAETLASMFRFLYGDLIGQIVVGPLLLVAAFGAPPRREGFRRALGAVTLAALALLLLVQVYDRLAEYVLLLAFAPLFFLGFRHGWEGAAIGIALLGAVVQAMAQTGVLGVSLTVMQLELAVIGGGALVLGSASTALRLSHDALAQRHRELARKNDELAGLADELRQVTQRLVRIEEQGQRELASELDYELGHAIHALGTRISLAFRDVRDEQGTRFLESLREQVREIQDSLRRALRQLRPPMLDSHGLRHALENGPLRDMLDDAGVAFEPRFEGRIDALDDDARTTVYRICQATVREAVRLESVRRLVMQVRLLAPDGAPARIALDIDLEFSPYADPMPAAQPLPAIRDRVLAEHGRYVVEPLAHGQRHSVAFVPAGD
jgi:two-component system sensor histidine kinase UhpB